MVKNREWKKSVADSERGRGRGRGYCVALTNRNTRARKKEKERKKNTYKRTHTLTPQKKTGEEKKIVSKSCKRVVLCRRCCCYCWLWCDFNVKMKLTFLWLSFRETYMANKIECFIISSFFFSLASVGRSSNNNNDVYLSNKTVRLFSNIKHHRNYL